MQELQAIADLLAPRMLNPRACIAQSFLSPYRRTKKPASQFRCENENLIPPNMELN